MNKKNYLVVLLAAMCVSLFLACPQSSADSGYDSIDPRLAGSWKCETDENRTFTIEANGTLVAIITPMGMTDEGTVKGNLERQGDDYFMRNMKCDDAAWGSTVNTVVQGQACQLTFIDAGNDDKFVFTCSGSSKDLIETFFGGTYIRTE